MALDPNRLRVPPSLSDLGAALGKKLPRRLKELRMIGRSTRALGANRRPTKKG